MVEWKPIEIAPANVELELSLYDKGEYHALVFPCQRDNIDQHDIRNGVRGTAMPPWPGLSNRQTWDLVAYLVSLKGR